MRWNTLILSLILIHGIAALRIPLPLYRYTTTSRYNSVSPLNRYQRSAIHRSRSSSCRLFTHKQPEPDAEPSLSVENRPHIEASPSFAIEAIPSLSTEASYSLSLEAWLLLSLCFCVTTLCSLDKVSCFACVLSRSRG